MMSSCMSFMASYMLLTAGALSAYWMPALSTVSKHGKVRFDDNLRSKMKDHKLTRHSPVVELLHYFDSWTVPKSFFVYFYVLGCMVTAVCLYLEIMNDVNYTQTEAIAALLQFWLHSAVRLWECVYETEYGSSRMHIAGLFVGLAHYVLVPSSMRATASNDCVQVIFMGRSYMKSIGLDQYSSFILSVYETVVGLSYSGRWVRYLTAVLLFTLGSVYQRQSHRVLAALKQKNKQSTEKELSKYSLPSGGLFEYVCCPHYFCEFIIYISLLLIHPSPVLVAMAVWVAINLAVVAQQNFTFYRTLFPDEMKGRQIRRMFPFIW